MNLRHFTELTVTAVAAGTLGWYSAGFGAGPETAVAAAPAR